MRILPVFLCACSVDPLLVCDVRAVDGAVFLCEATTASLCCSDDGQACAWRVTTDRSDAELWWPCSDCGSDLELIAAEVCDG